ncbi:MAG: DUF4330 domain-containing protein [Clostridia bacterium]|nr:DUF4330 domain-containing protein [Clostridia bacterium]
MEHANKKFRFNIIDAFVILLIVALILGTAYFILMETGFIPQDQANERTITYTVRLSETEEQYLGSFAVGSEVFNSSTFDSLGSIYAIEHQKTRAISPFAEAADGTEQYSVRQAEYDDKYDIYITVQAKATIDENGIAYVGSQRITIGSCVYFKCGNFAATTYITDFSVA